MNELEKSRKIISDVDIEIAKLFEKRMEAAGEVAKYKQKHGLEIFDQVREQQLIDRNSALVEEKYRSYYINFLQGMMDISKNYQRRILEGMRVAYSGVKGAFANIAAKNLFPDAIHVAYPDFKEAYYAVVNGECDCAMLPIENSYNGDVGQVMDLAFFGNLHINGIYEMEVVQNLLAVKGATLEDIKEVISHPQALGQCAEYIKKNNLKEIQAVNTAVAAKFVADSGRTDIAAIGSDDAAKEYGLVKLDAHINTGAANTTRFAVFSRAAKEPSVRDNHFVLVFTVNHEAGSLGKAINVIAEYGFNLQALKSRPTKKLSWSYYFYAEGEGNIFSEKGKEMFAKLQECCNNATIIGSFEKELI